jgi:hypothetical protein
MAERFLFDRDVWPDQRRAVRATGKGSVWQRLLFALTLLLSERAVRASWLYRQIWLDSADGYGLTLWGQRYEIPRYYGEPDDDYRSRIVAERMIARGDASNASRKKILNVVYGIDPTTVRIDRVYDHHFAVGGLSDRGNEPGSEGGIGSVLGSRDYAMHAYRIYAPLPADLEAKLQKAVSMLHDINIGGNYWELWFERGVQTGPQTESDDRPLSAGPSSPMMQYSIY